MEFKLDDLKDQIDNFDINVLSDFIEKLKVEVKKANPITADLSLEIVIQRKAFLNGYETALENVKVGIQAVKDKKKH